MTKREVDEFTAVAQEFTATGKYCKHDPNTISGKKFWIEQAKRSIYGYNIGSDKISGYNYFYLNFSPIKKAVSSDTSENSRKRGSLEFSFPNYWDFQRKMFDYFEEAEAEGEHASVMKARRRGVSFIGGSMCNRNYYLIPRSSSYVYASDKAYLTGDGGILSKAWDMMSFIDENTPWTKRRQAVDTTLHKRSSYKIMENGTYIEKGFKSEIVGVTIGGDWNRVRGKQAKLVLWEEAGANAQLLKAYNAALPSLKQGNIVYGLSVAFGCVCAGTKVWNNNGDLVNIENLDRTKGILGFDGNKVSNEDITYMQEPKEKPCYKLTTNFGTTLECSEDHPILWSKNGFHKQPRIKKLTGSTSRPVVKKTCFKEVKDIKVGDQVAIIEEVPIFSNKILWEPRLIGWLVGDGSYGFDQTPKLSNCESEILNYVENNFDTSLSHQHITKDKREYKEIRIKNICQKLREIGIYGQTKLKKTLPLNIHSYNKESICEFIGGFFDTDGYVRVSDKIIRVILTSGSEELLFEVKLLLQKLGIHGNIQRIKKSEKNQKDKNDYFRLSISDKRSLLSFHKNIKLFPKEKQRRLDLIPKHFENKGEKISKSIHGIRFELVKSIEFIGNKPVYNLTASNTHTYIANGIVTHNTAGSDTQDFIGLEELFFNPKGHSIHPLRNEWEEDSLGGYCGFFYPEWANREGYMDEMGNSNREAAFADWQKELDTIKEHAKNPDAVVRFMAEHPMLPSHCLLQSKHNEFPVTEIKKTLAKLLSSEQMQAAEFVGEFELDEVTNRYKWKPNPDLSPIRVFPLDLTGESNTISIDGCWVIYEHPIIDESGSASFGRYIAGNDPVDDDRDASLESESLLSTFILDTWTDRIVAEYSGRPYNVEAYYENLRRGLLYYNAVCNYEQEKKGLYTYFKNKNSLYLLADNLEILSDKGISMFKGEGNRSKGTMGTQPVQKHARDLLKTWLISPSPGTDEVLNVHRLRSIPLLKELMYWNPDGNYDRCVLENTMITTSNGIKQIKDIKKGEKILTLSGKYNEVYTTHKNYFSGKIVKIKALGNYKSLDCTYNHPILIKKFVKKPYGRNWRKLKNNLTDEVFINAENVSKGDFIFIPKRNELKDSKYNNDLLYLLGWYLSDGWCSNKTNVCRIFLHESQKEIGEDLIKIINRYFKRNYHIFKPNIDKNGRFVKGYKNSQKSEAHLIKSKNSKMYIVEIHSEDCKEFLTSNCGTANNKLLSEDLYNCKNLLWLVKGYFEGDGHFRSDVRSDGSIRTSLELSTIYDKLLDQVRQILLDNGIWSTLRYISNENKRNSKPQVSINITNDDCFSIIKDSKKFKQIFHIGKNNKKYHIETESGFWVPVKKIEYENFDGKVYNISVENDETYVANGILTHNCSALGMLMLYRAEKYRQITERKQVIKSKFENSRILQKNKLNSYGNFQKNKNLFHNLVK